MVGIAGSGKTTYATDMFPGHVQVSMDRYRKDKSWAVKRRGLIHRYDCERPLGSILIDSGNKKAECVLVNDALKEGRDVIVDDTNLTKKIRRPYVILAQKHRAVIRVVYFRNIRQAYARNARRVKGEDVVPKKAIDKQRDELEPPSENEGFDTILFGS